MRGNFILAALPAAALLLGAAAEIWAMSAYARSFDMKCGECHKQRIPELNDFGIAFYKNGFTLPGNEQGKSAAPPQEEVSSSSSPDSADTLEKKAADTAGIPDEKGESPTPVPPPEVPLVIYQGQAGDGSVYFTDNPLLKGRLQEKGRQKAEPPAVTPKVARYSPKRAEAAPPKETAAPRYRTYQQCMERQLDNTPAATSQQMMELLMQAERACAGYPMRNR